MGRNNWFIDYELNSGVMTREAKKSENEELKQDNPSGMKESDKKTNKREPKKGLPIRNKAQKDTDS